MEAVDVRGLMVQWMCLEVLYNMYFSHCHACSTLLKNLPGRPRQLVHCGSAHLRSDLIFP